jgi:hypothetical protein
MTPTWICLKAGLRICRHKLVDRDLLAVLTTVGDRAASAAIAEPTGIAHTITRAFTEMQMEGMQCLMGTWGPATLLAVCLLNIYMLEADRVHSSDKSASDDNPCQRG